MKLKFSILLSLLVFVFACSKLEPKARPEEETLDGPLAGLSDAENAAFLAGDAAFNGDLFTSASGLGPIFVASSCGSCHAGDGKGTPFTTLTRFGQSDSTGNKFLHLGGPQLQNRAIPGYLPETIPPGASFTKLTPPANTGLGFIELVSDADLLAMSDPNDLDGDGISGVPNWSFIPDFVEIPKNAISKGGKYICRFGKKASAFDLLHQTVAAYNQDIGITSSFMPLDVYTGKKTDPEISDNRVRQVVAYLQTLKAPMRRNENHPQVISGENLFKQIGCESCHKQTLKTGYSKINALSFKTFHPYSDLLLHDMGSGLDDGYTEGSALSSEWRTPPLWGLGLSHLSQGGQWFLMHDGRARSIEEAIQYHGGEANGSRLNYSQLSQSEKEAVLTFLKSL